VASVLGAGTPLMMVVNHCPTKQGWTPPLVVPHHWLGVVLLCAGSCVGLLLVIVLIPLLDWCRPSSSFGAMAIELQEQLLAQERELESREGAIAA
jgi:hypothetical protein